MYALNLSESGRILSATYPNYAPVDAVIVDYLPDGNIFEYKYELLEDSDTGELHWEYIHDPLPIVEVEEMPSQLDIIEAQVTYTAMMTDTLLEV